MDTDVMAEMAAQQQQQAEAAQAAALAAQQQQMQQNYNSESDEEQYEMEGFSDDPALQAASISWMKWFCALEGHEYLVEIDNEFVQDPTNLQGLQEKFSKEKMKKCLMMILCPQQPNDEDLQDEQFLELNQESSDLYCMLHARFVLSARGMAKVYQKYLNGTFGTCPRALCDRQKVLPVGLSDTFKTSRFKIYCPRCEEVYLAKNREVNIDGASYGTSFPQSFLMHYPMAVVLPPKIYHYEPKIFGFKVAGKRGSKYFEPPTGNVRYVNDSVFGLELQTLKENKIINEKGSSLERSLAAKLTLDSASKDSSVQQNEQSQAAGQNTQNETNKQGGGAGGGGNRKNRRRNRNR